MADMEEEAELLLLAIQDFKHALASGCSEATATLQSYLVELRGAPDELLHQLATAWREHTRAGALAAAAASPAACWCRTPTAPSRTPPTRRW